jgi:transcriptional regulator with XRE-family HTH domain
MRAIWTPHTDSFRSPAAFLEPLFSAWLLATASNQRDNVQWIEQDPMPSKHREFAKFVTTHREALGLSMHQLAKEVGVGRSTVHYWESGAFVPEPHTLESLARGLKVSYEDLFALCGYANPQSLPNPEPYLRAKYPDISQRKLAEAKRLFADIDRQFGEDGSTGKRRR